MTTSLTFSNIRVAGIASPDATVQIYFGKQAEGSLFSDVLRVCVRLTTR